MLSRWRVLLGFLGGRFSAFGLPSALLSRRTCMAASNGIVDDCVLADWDAGDGAADSSAGGRRPPEGRTAGAHHSPVAGG